MTRTRSSTQLGTLGLLLRFSLVSSCLGCHLLFEIFATWIKHCLTLAQHQLSLHRYIEVDRKNLFDSVIEVVNEKDSDELRAIPKIVFVSSSRSIILLNICH
jgi:hypothetical protein